MDVFPVSRLEQRELFYAQEFVPEKAEHFFVLKPQFVHVEFGSRVSKHPQKVRELLPSAISGSLLKDRLVQDVPEKVLYDRNVYKDPKKCLSCLQFSKCFSCPYDNFLGQELVLEIPASRVKCLACRAGQTCPVCVDIAVRQAFSLHDELLDRFDDVRVVLTGDGAQVHVRDVAARSLSFAERSHLIRELAHRFAIRPLVGPEDRLSLLPFSLNGSVSRRVLPVVSIDDPVAAEVLLPSFLKLTPLER